MTHKITRSTNPQSPLCTKKIPSTKQGSNKFVHRHFEWVRSQTNSSLALLPPSFFSRSACTTSISTSEWLFRSTHQEIRWTQVYVYVYLFIYVSFFLSFFHAKYKSRSLPVAGERARAHIQLRYRGARRDVKVEDIHWDSHRCTSVRNLRVSEKRVQVWVRADAYVNDTSNMALDRRA